MKQNRKKQQRYLKRKKFSGILAWYLALCVFLLEAALGVFILFDIHEDAYRTTELREDIFHLIGVNLKQDYAYVKQQLPEEKEKQFSRFAALDLYSYGFDGRLKGGAVLYDVESKVQLAETVSADYLQYEDYTSSWEGESESGQNTYGQRNRYVYEAAGPLGGELEAALDQKTDEHEYAFADDETEFYIEGDRFYVGNAVVTVRSEDRIMNRREIPGEIDEKREELQLVHCKEGEHVYYTLCRLRDYSEELTEAAKQLFEKDLKNTMQEFSGGGEKHREGLFRYVTYEYEKIELDEETSVLLVGAYRFDYLSMKGKKVLFSFLLALAEGLILGFLVARYRYARLKARYDLEDYQRNLTNAMAHDLKSPLMIISGMAENLKENIHTGKRTYYAEQIMEQVQDMNRMIEQLLLYSKLDPAAVLKGKQAVNMATLAEKLQKKYESLCEEKGMIMEISGSLTLNGNEALLTHMLDNLMQNAVLHGKEGSVIRLEFKEDGLSIENETKRPLTKEELSVLTEAFEKRGERPRSGGHGLGLSIAARIAELHGLEFAIGFQDAVFTAKVKERPAA